MTARISLLLSLALASVAVGQQVQQPTAGSSARKAILDGLRGNEVVHRLEAEWKGKVVFTHVAIRQLQDWAWVVASPQTEDEKHIIEPLTSVMHAKGGQWRVVEFISDEVAPSDRPEEAYQKWRSGFLIRHPECLAKIFPATFD